MLETVPNILDTGAGLSLFPDRPVPEVEVLKGEGAKAGALVPKEGEVVVVVTVLPNMSVARFDAPNVDIDELSCCGWLSLDPHPPDPPRLF